MSNVIDLSWGEQVFEKKQEYPWLIDKLIRHRDVVLLLGREKTGKSVLAQQIGFNLTSGTPFLEKFNVTEKVPVLYIQTEGKREEMVERIIRMKDAVSFNSEFFGLLYKKFLPLDIDEWRDEVARKIETLPVIPKVLIVDAVYMAMAGDLIDNRDTRKFISSICAIAETFEQTVILVHHESKEVLDQETHLPVERGDQASYGSATFLWFVDRILRLRRKGKRTRILSRDTDRASTNYEHDELLFVDDPLHFELSNDMSPTVQSVLAMIRVKRRLSSSEVSSILNISESTARKALQSLKDAREISPGLFEYTKEV